NSSNAPTESVSIDPPRYGISVKWDGNGRVDVNSLTDRLGAFGKIAELLDDPFQIMHRGCRFAIADRIDPQDAVFLRQPLHDVFLAERIAVPVVAEANDVLSLNHVFHLSAIAACVSQISQSRDALRGMHSAADPILSKDRRHTPEDHSSSDIGLVAAMR